MTYLRLKNNRLRISLTKYETEQIFGSAEKIDRGDPKTQTALKMLFKRAIKDNSFDPDCNSVWIEVVKNLSGGYDIYFTKNKTDISFPVSSLIVLEFASCEDAINASKAIVYSSDVPVQSRFYRLCDRYRMVVSAKGGIYDIPSAVEFADKIYNSSAETAKTAEHGKIVIKENAIELLSKL